jgi:hypothetical protein
MKATSKNRLFALWESYETRARVWFWLFVAASVVLALSLLATLRLVGRPREVVRIGCDGIPQVVRIDEQAYSEPDEREIRAFAAQFAVFFARADSYSVVNDYVWCAARMAPELQQAFKGEAQKAIAVVETLKRRTEVEASALAVGIDKRPFPWKAAVKGMRRILAVEDGASREEAFSLDLELVRTERTLQNPFGLLVWRVQAGADATASPSAER